MDSNLVVRLIKEVVKNEVKKQVKEEITKLIKSGAVTLNKRKPDSLAKLTEVKSTQQFKKATPTAAKAPLKDFSKNKMINEILNSTQPFTAQERAEGGVAGAMGGSVLDMIQRDSEEDWGTINMTSNTLSHQPTPQPTVESSGNESVDLVAKALNRDYTELVKRFK